MRSLPSRVPPLRVRRAYGRERRRAVREERPRFDERRSLRREGERGQGRRRGRRIPKEVWPETRPRRPDLGTTWRSLPSDRGAERLGGLETVWPVQVSL